MQIKKVCKIGFHDIVKVEETTRGYYEILSEAMEKYGLDTDSLSIGKFLRFSSNDLNCFFDLSDYSEYYVNRIMVGNVTDKVCIKCGKCYNEVYVVKMRIDLSVQLYIQHNMEENKRNELAKKIHDERCKK
jgi:hypothetical protein